MNEGLLLLVACIIAYLYFCLARYKKRTTEQYLREANMPSSMPKRSYFAFFIKSICIVAAWVMLAICIMQPGVEQKTGWVHPEQFSGPEHLPKVDEVAFILDVSASMRAKDASDGGSRIARAKEIIESLVESLGGINVSLMAFAGDAITVVPDTLDYLYFRILMQAEGINDTNQAGTNLLAMVDAIQTKYVDSPYRKSVRLVLLTDGEDTGYLALSDSAKKEAEQVLVERIAKTASDRLKWDVVGLGTEVGAEVPQVVFEGKSVTSHMQRALLERIAQAGKGHFYAESDIPITEISDDLLASQAGPRVSSEQEERSASVLAPRSSFEVLCLIAVAAILIFASITLPQYEKKKTIACILMLFMSVGLDADESPSQKIDVAIEYANAGRGDLALDAFSKLLQTKLTTQERASVLYNIAVLQAASLSYWEAIHTLDQIDDDMFDTVMKTSPQLGVQIAYDGALISIAYIKREIQNMRFSQNELDQCYQALQAAARYSQKLSSLQDVQKAFIVVLTYIHEELANLSSTLGKLSSFVAAESLTKTGLLEELGALLESQFYELLDLYLAQNANEQNISGYMQMYAGDNVQLLTMCLDRLLILLQAPATEAQASMHGFLAQRVKQLHIALTDSFQQDNLDQALSVLNQLSNMVLLVQQEVIGQDVSLLLTIREAIDMQYSLAQDERLRAFWQKEWQINETWTLHFLDKKIALSKPFEAALLQLLKKRLKDASSDSYYWRILSQKEGVTYAELAVKLHGASHVDVSATVEALRDRVSLLDSKEAESQLEAMLKTDSLTLQFQDLVTSWFYIEPQKALSFMFGLLSDECNALHLDPRLNSFIAQTDFQLTLHLLSLIAQKGLLNEVYHNLSQKVDWFTIKDKRDLDFFTMSLELSWLKAILTEQIESIETITNAVDFGVDYQKKTMTLLRYSQEADFAPKLDLLSRMQKRLIGMAQDALNALPTKGPKITKVIELMHDASVQVVTQSKELASMQAVQDDLEQASKILHSLKSESQEKQSKSSGESESNQNLSSQMQKEALKLTPELSIRLLQEMENRDKGLETELAPQTSSNPRPW